MTDQQQNEAIKAKNHGPVARTVMAIASNAYPGSAGFTEPSQKAAVKRLVKKGFMSITSYSKFAGFQEINAKLTSEPPQFVCCGLDRKEAVHGIYCPSTR